MATNNSQPILELRGICKYFGGVHALEDVDFELYPNEILAIVGDNGAGKSTLIKAISGAHQPDKGEMYFQGEKIEIPNPHVARELGIETVYQELALVNNLDVVENIFLGRTLTKLQWFIDRKRMVTETAYGHRYRLLPRQLDQRILQLSVEQRKRMG